LILAAANKPAYARLINAAVAYGKSKGGSVENQVDAAMDRLVRATASPDLDPVPGDFSWAFPPTLFFF